MRLAEIQQTLCESLTLQDASGAQALLLQSLRQTGAPPEAGLEVYRSNHVATFERALNQVYPVCASIVGNRPFYSLCRNYLQAYPVRNWNLDLYGEFFPSLLEQMCATHAALGELDYLPDLAQLEWYWHAAYYADEQLNAIAEKISFDEDPIERIKLCAPPSLHVLKTRHPIYAIWRAHRENSNTEYIEALSSEQYLLILRSGYTVNVQPVQEEPYLILKACETQPALQQLIQQFGAPCLSELIQNGWLTVKMNQTDK